MYADLLGRNCKLRHTTIDQLAGGEHSGSGPLSAPADVEVSIQVVDLLKRQFCNKDAAEYIGLAKSTLEKYRVTGRGPVYSAFGRIIVYEVGDQDASVEARKRLSISALSKRV
jgi:hypothetical protein